MHVESSGPRFTHDASIPQILQPQEKTTKEVYEQTLKEKELKAKSTGKGTTGSVKLVNENDKTVCIFKSRDAVITFKKVLEIVFKKLFGIARPTEFLVGNTLEEKCRAKHYNSILASDLDKALKFHIVPETVEHTISGELVGKPGEEVVGSAQEWAKEGHVEMTMLVGSAIEKEPIGLSLFQKLAIFDYLTGNLDRHFGNILGVVDEGHLISLQAIDNDNCFPESNPAEKDTVIRKNQYQWGEHPLADVPFSDDMRQAIKDITPEALRAFFAAEAEKMPDAPPNYFTGQMVENVIRRLEVLRRIADISESTPAMLSQYKSDSEIKAFLIQTVPRQANAP